MCTFTTIHSLLHLCLIKLLSLSLSLSSWTSRCISLVNFKLILFSIHYSAATSVSPLYSTPVLYLKTAFFISPFEESLDPDTAIKLTNQSDPLSGIQHTLFQLLERDCQYLLDTVNNEVVAVDIIVYIGYSLLTYNYNVFWDILFLYLLTLIFRLPACCLLLTNVH